MLFTGLYHPADSARATSRYAMRRDPVHHARVAAMLLAASALPVLPAWAAQDVQTPLSEQYAYRFDSNLLLGTSLGATGIERFNRPNAVDAGLYQVDIFVNGSFRVRRAVEFRSINDDGVYPCVDDAFLIESGVLAQNLSAADASEDRRDSETAGSETPQREPRRDCRPLELRIAGASSRFDVSTLRLDISVPQAAMKRVPRGAVDPVDLDAGRKAAFVNYDANYYHSSALGRGTDSSYLGLNSGVNVGMWRFRQQSSYRYTSGTGYSGGHWNAIRTYAQRALPSIQSELTLGDSYTSGNLFTSIAFRGIHLETDERMWPDSQRGYAPVVRGVASTNARVVVRQGANEIYQTTVAPGPFTIDDLYPTSYQGDLEVEVREADGRVSHFTVPFSAVPDSMRPGVSRYAFTLGQVRDVADSHTTFADLTWQHGLTNGLTGNAGARLGNDYQALLGGLVLGTSAGAFGVNTIYSRAKDVNGSNVNGWRAAATYSHTFQPTSTTFSLAGYRYSTQGYRDLSDALGARSAHARGVNWNSSTFRQRNQFVANVNQSFGRFGQVFLSASRSDYYGDRSRDTQMQFSYSNNYRSISYNLSFARQQAGTLYDSSSQNLLYQGQSATVANVVMLSVSVPLGAGPRAASVAGAITRNSQGGSSYQASVAGTADEAQTLSYGVSASHETQGATSSISTNVQKRLTATTMSGSYSQGQGFWQAGAGARGAAVIHSGGVTFGPYLSETFGLVEAEGARGARVRNGLGARVDRFGYALIPSLTPYRYNDIALDSKGINRNAELKGNQQRVAPFAGSMVKVKFTTRSGHALLIKSALADGEPLPLGADVYGSDDAVIGVVGQGGQVYARAPGDRGSVVVRWGKRRDEQCAIAYELTGQNADLPLHRLSGDCMPIGDHK